MDIIGLDLHKKTEVYFTGSNGIEWEVWDARRDADGRLRRQYPSSDDAAYRYFVRYQPLNGLAKRQAIEIRRYRFRRDESRWFQADLFEQQVTLSEQRPIRK